MAILQGGNILEGAEREVFRYSRTAAALSANGVLAATVLGTGVTTTVSTGFGALDVPRSLSIVGNALGINGSVVINGKDIFGSTISETIVANGTTTVQGSKAFASITSVVLPARNTAGDTISIGWGNKLGLYHYLQRNTVLFAFLGNTKEGTAPTVTTDTTNISGNTVLLNSALNGTQVDVYYIGE